MYARWKPFHTILLIFWHKVNDMIEIIRVKVNGRDASERFSVSHSHALCI
jgi:hypothetical protein